jgi:hydrogenase expression/formation protein HypC
MLSVEPVSLIDWLVIRCRGSAEKEKKMCLGIPGAIVALHDDDYATVSVNGVERPISISLLAEEGVGIGDWVLVHVGFALSKIDEQEAALTLDQIKKLGAAWTDEMEAFQSTAILAPTAGSEPTP